MAKNKKPAHGGKRKGSGRPPGKPTRTLAYRVPLDKAPQIDKAIRRAIAFILTKAG